MPIASIDAGDLNKVWEIRTLGKERDVEARKMLEMAAKQVQPIMRKRKWTVKLLSEFWYAQFFFQLPHNSPLFPLSPPFLSHFIDVLESYGSAEIPWGSC